jgi:L-threonylcarbamoyladenylate synthase
MNTLFLSKENISEEILKKLSIFIKEGKIIAFPTETVYGLGAHVFNEKALKKIFNLKKRPQNKSLIVHVASFEDIEKVAQDIPKEFHLLFDKFFPGPLTVVLKKKEGISSFVSKDNTVAVRMPQNDITLRLIRLVGDPIVGTSANLSSQENSIQADAVKKNFDGKISAIIDGGRCSFGLPSTVLSLVGEIKILRNGVLEKKQIEEVLKRKVQSL